MTLSFDDLAAHLSSPGPLDRLRDSLRTPPQREAIRRCAALREFDRALYEAVVIPAVGAGAPPFDEAIAWRELQVASTCTADASPDDRYRVRDRRRELETWPAEEQRPFRRAVAGLLRGATAQWQRDELLQQLLALGDAEAAKLFEEMGKEAGARFDLARSQALLGLALEHYSRADEPTRVAIDAYRALLRARRLWKDEYYKSLVYLSREHVDSFLEELLGATGPWIGNLYAGGGLGKTAAIRALISGTCVPRRIPVSHIDFSVTRFDSRPTFLLLKVIQQFEEQIPGTPFVSLFNTLSELESVSTGSMKWSDGEVAYNFNRFASTLREVRGVQPSLLIFDNMEDMLLAHADVLGIVQAMDAAHTEYPALRVLFSGRYSLFEKDRVPGIEELFRGVTLDRRIERFDDQESRDYLVDRRGIPESEELGRIITAAGGMPFKLSLFGDLLLDSPEISIDDLVATAEVDLTYLIVRIVRRLDVRLQWILRYGVVPRRLTKTFLRDVMAPFLPAKDAPFSALDEPLKRLPKPLQKDIFAVPEEQVAIDELWEKLTRYAAEHSWVSTGKGETGTLSVHEEVRRPMRRLLRQNQIFRNLHRAAAKHFDRTGEAPETVYHLFHLGDPAAPSYWRRALDEAIAGDRVDDVLGLAGAVLNDDFFEDGKPVTDNQGKAIVPAALLADALIAQAFAFLRKGRENGRTDRAWTDALTAGQQASLGGERVEDTIAIVNASVAVNNEEIARAADRLQTVGKRGLTVQLLRGMTYASLGSTTSSIEALESAKRMAFTPGVFRDEPLHLLAWPPGEIERSLVMTLVSQSVVAGRYDAALNVLREVIARRETPPPSRIEFALRLGELQIELLRPAEALATLAEINDKRRDALRAEAELLRYASLDALDVCEASAPELPDGTVDDWGQRARMLQLRGRIHAGMMEIAQARSYYERAHSAWREAAQRDPRDRHGPAQCLAAHALTELDELFNYDRAVTLVDQLDRAVDARDKAAVFAAAILRARVKGELDDLPEPVTARQRVEVAIVRRDVPAIRDALAAISPPDARLAALAPLRHCAEFPEPGDDAGVLKLLPKPDAIIGPWRSTDPHDRARAAIELVEAYRAFGRARRARRLLSWAYKRLEGPRRPLLDRARHAAEMRLGVRREPEIRAIVRWKRLLAAEHPDFLGVLLFEEAQVQEWDRDRHDLLQEAGRQSISQETQAWIGDRIRPHLVAAETPAREAKAPPTRDLVISVAAPHPGIVFINTQLPGLVAPLELRAAWGLERLGFEGYSRRAEIISYGAVKLFSGNPSDAAQMMREMILDPRVSRWAAGPLDVRLELPDSSWQAYPWELAFDSRWSPVGVRSVYRARRQPGRRFPSRQGMRVLVVRRTAQTEMLVQRSSFGSNRIDDAYRLITSDVHVLEDPIAEHLFDTLRRFRPHLIHISASPGESPSLGGAILELASRDLEVAAMAPQSFPVGLFVEGVGTLGGGSAGPVMIIDATTPLGETEIMRQLLLRNVFAAELFASGKFSAIIATGLFREPAMAPSVYSEVAEGVALGRGYGELAAEIRERTSPDDDPAAAAVAFFCDEANLNLPENRA